jgi:hypothetical protein
MMGDKTGHDHTLMQPGIAILLVSTSLWRLIPPDEHKGAIFRSNN